MPASDSDAVALGRKIQAYLRANALRREDHEQIGPFLAGFDAQDANPYMNYAVPEDGAAPGAHDVANLVTAFRRRARKPRLEYIADAAPDVETALLAHGFAIEQRFAVLTCTLDGVKDISAEGIFIESISADGDIAEAANANAEAYAQPVAAEPLRRMIDQGGVLMLARDTRAREKNGGVGVGAGMATPPHEGITEVAGIGVRPAFRRRGIAAALTSAIAREAFRRGATLAWLTPGSDGAERVYARAGFVRAIEQLHISMPG